MISKQTRHKPFFFTPLLIMMMILPSPSYAQREGGILDNIFSLFGRERVEETDINVVPELGEDLAVETETEKPTPDIKPSSNDVYFNIGLGEDEVKITTGFTGDEVRIFGTKPPGTQPVIIVEGPRRDIVVRRKKKILGIWLNADSMAFEDVPSYYDFAWFETEKKDLDDAFREKEAVGLNYLTIDPKSERYSKEDYALFKTALINLNQERGVFSDGVNMIENISDRLFRTSFHFPANIAKGTYKVRAFLLKDRQVVAQQELSLKVSQEGVAADVYSFSEKQSFLYGIFGVLIAALLGWGATQILRQD